MVSGAGCIYFLMWNLTHGVSFLVAISHLSFAMKATLR